MYLIEFPRQTVRDEIERVRLVLRSGGSVDSEYIAGIVAALQWMDMGGEPPSTRLIQHAAAQIPGGRGGR